MKVIVQPISQPAEGQILLPLLFDGVPPEKAAKIAALGQTLQAACADGKLTLTEDLFLGMALAALFSK